ncbi:MAG: hypothetical protein ACERKD_07175 [Prolixibacteraceae bacterium]
MKTVLFIFIFLGMLSGVSESPHGVKLKQDCSECHTSRGWTVDIGHLTFDHQSTGFPLNGQHGKVTCSLCHESLVFDQIKTNCVDCHQDVHQQSVGFECAQCHNSSTWIIENTMDLHRQSRFPLMGMHALADCNSCHVSAPNLKFESLGIDCYDCHKETFLATTQPNHIEEGYSSNCTECHTPKSYEWTGSGFNHDIFPLLGGHREPSCADCHGDDQFASISAECVDCHLFDFEQATNPTHDPMSFSSQCNECHTIDPNWQPAKFTQHDGEAFPIYSGSHRSAWKSCTECHENPNDYTSFTCTSCHEHGKVAMDLKHREERDYEYQSSACFDCHPRGRAEDD